MPFTTASWAHHRNSRINQESYAGRNAVPWRIDFLSRIRQSFLKCASTSTLRGLNKIERSKRTNWVGPTGEVVGRVMVVEILPWHYVIPNGPRQRTMMLERHMIDYFVQWYWSRQRTQKKIQSTYKKETWSLTCQAKRYTTQPSIKGLLNHLGSQVCGTSR